MNESEISDVVSKATSAPSNVVMEQLKRNRSTAKGILTKKRNEIELLINKFESSAAVELKLSELKSAFEQLKLSHGNYHDTLTEEEEIQDSLDYLSYEELKVEDLISRLQKCKDSVEKMNLEGPLGSKSNHSELASNTTKSRKSASSVSSSVSNARAKVSARKAGLLAKANMLKKMQSLEQEGLKLKQMQQDLNLEAKLAQADAEERALMEAEEGNVGGVVNDEPPLPLNAYVSSWMEKCDEKVDHPPIQAPVDATKPDVNPALQLNSVENPQEEKNEVKVEEPQAEELNDT